MKISLNHGKEVLLNDSDLPLISPYKWYAAHNNNTWYAQSWNKKNGKDKGIVLMHRIIMGNPQPTKNWEIDHINRNGLDNRRDNLRIVSRSENIRNQSGRSKSGLGFKGVYRQVGGKRFMAALFPKGEKYIHLGLYDTPEKAAKAYDIGIRRLYGKSAVLNFPSENK